jgi:hypothetical protein
MNDLTLSTHPMTFEQLVELGRSAIPVLAQRWTDHNAHDPGIMLVELVAWIAEAQMYGIDRLRRDERLAYARILGVRPRGPVPASGLIWPATVWPSGTIVGQGAKVTPDYPAPAFRATHATELTSARLTRVRTAFADGSVRDWTRSNLQDGGTFMPFGSSPSRGDRLELSFSGTLTTSARPGAFLSIGFEIDNAVAASGSARPSPQEAPRLSVSVRGRRAGRLEAEALAIKTDSTNGLLTSGVLLVSFGDAARGLAADATIAIESATGGFLRAPRVRRIGFNVLAVQQLEPVEDIWPCDATGPGMTYRLQNEGVFFSDPIDAVTVAVTAGATTSSWKCVRDLGVSGPGDRHFELDPANGVLTFGNGLNGAIPPPNSHASVGYQVSAGNGGNLPKGASWSVQTLAGIYGTNSEAMTNGGDARGLTDLRALARARSRTSRPVVTSRDLCEAALGFQDLGVTRAIELPAAPGCPRVRGARVLLVVGPHDLSSGGAPSAEPVELLDEVRRRITPLLPLGERLTVRGPRYVPVRITATLVAVENASPQAVQAAAVAQLQRRLAAVLPDSNADWPFGRTVALTTVKGWLRQGEGVARVRSATLGRSPATSSVAAVSLGPADLPLLQIGAADITVERAPVGARP